MQKTKTKLFIPSFTSWVKALRLAVPNFIGANFVFSFYIWLSIRLANPAFLLLCIALSFTWYLTLHFLYLLFLKLLWKETPKLLAFPSRLAILNGFLIGTISGLLTASIYCLIFSVDLAYMESFDRALRKLGNERLGLTFILWLPITAYIYHLISIINQKISIKKTLNK